jgi:hypothetical protein
MRPGILTEAHARTQAALYQTRRRAQAVGQYRATSLIGNSAPLGPFSRTIPRALRGPRGGALVFISEVPIAMPKRRSCRRPFQGTEDPYATRRCTAGFFLLGSPLILLLYMPSEPRYLQGSSYAKNALLPPSLAPGAEDPYATRRCTAGFFLCAPPLRVRSTTQWSAGCPCRTGTTAVPIKSSSPPVSPVPGRPPPRGALEAESWTERRSATLKGLGLRVEGARFEV